MIATIRRAAQSDVDGLIPLFDAYRQFYKQPSDPAGCRQFLAERLERKESTIFLATDAAGAAVGFTQLYPSFSSVLARRIWILNDLFVVAAARRTGVARALMSSAHEFARETGAVRVVLATHRLNQPAQRLYEDLGYRKDEDFLCYERPL